MCVLARVLLGLGHARREHSAVEILMALEHDGSRGGAGGWGGMEEREMARLRYRLREDGGGSGSGSVRARARFVPANGKG